MEDLRKYESKYDYINKFFDDNNIVLMMSDTTEKEKTILQEIDYNNKKYACIIMNKEINSDKKFEILKNITFNIINRNNESNYLYIDGRYNIGTEVTLSKKMNIKMKKIDNKTKNTLITYNYFKIKDLIYRQGKDDFYTQYKVARSNEYLHEIHHKYENKIIKGTIDEYFYIQTLKNVIHIYNKEVDRKLDYNNPSFRDKMLFKYLDNYFSKFIIIDYDELEVKKFISKYYINDAQSEDLTYSFINVFLSFYKIISNMNFTYENSYNFNLKNFFVFSCKKASNIKCKKFYKYFDDIVEDEGNYYSFMFLLEILELTEHNSDKKDIINYMSVLELLLVKGNKDISIQIQNKILKLLNSGYTKNEFRLIYDYRSKIVHGDYKKSICKLQELSLMKKYEITQEEIQNDKYSNTNQLIEEKIRIQLFNALKLVLKYFIFKNHELKTIKKSN